MTPLASSPRLDPGAFARALLLLGALTACDCGSVSPDFDGGAPLDGGDDAGATGGGGGATGGGGGATGGGGGATGGGGGATGGGGGATGGGGGTTGGGGGTTGGGGGTTGGGGGADGGTAACGNSVVDYPLGEECDDGNLMGGDGCSGLCRVEVALGCGDGQLRPSANEECDDGNTTPGDGCSATCQLEPVGAACGDTTQATGEACDDGNLLNGDTCNPTCNLTNTTSLFVGVPGDGGYVDSDAGLVRVGGGGSLAADNLHLYLGDSANHVVRRVVIATGQTDTLAGDGTAAYLDNAVGRSARFNNPDALATDGTTLWVIDSRRVRAISLASPYGVNTLAGSGAQGCADSTGTAATFDDPRGLTYYRGHLYLVDANCAVLRRIDVTTGVVTTVAGTAYMTGTTDGVGAAARFISPRYIASDNSGMLYLADTNGFTVRSYTVATGAVGTFLGNGTTGYIDAVGTAARVHRPRGMTSDGTSLYWVEFNQHTVRQAVFATASATTLAGRHCDGGPCTGGYAEGVGTAARFNGPWSIVFHYPSRSLFMTDSANRVIRRVR